MSNFTIAHDEVAIIPLVLRAQAAAAAQGRPLRFMAAPWSPPAWMKSNFPANNYSITGMSCFPLGEFNHYIGLQRRSDMVNMGRRGASHT